MAYCTYCGTRLTDGIEVCPGCGAVNGTPNQPVVLQKPNQQPYQPPYQPYQPVPPYSNGGLIAWSIITLLLCTIPGIVALVNAAGINKCMTVEEQQRKISNAKTWCIVGTILGILAVIGSITANVLNS